MTKTELPAYRVLGVKFHPITQSQALDATAEFLEGDQFHLVVTLGTEMVMRALDHEQFKATVEDSAMVVPDGTGLVLASRYCGLQAPERVAGVELTVAMMDRFRDKRFYFLGGAPGVAEQAAENLRTRFEGLQIVGVDHGFFKDDQAMVEKIKSAEPDFLLVGTGSPRQELWLERYGEACGAKVGVGVGGTFDVLSGQVKRAPKWMIKIHMEWFYRFLLEPTRVSRITAIPSFLLRVFLAGRKGVTQIQ